jgi:hypothetical protein
MFYPSLAGQAAADLEMRLEQTLIDLIARSDNVSRFSFMPF